jgi:ketosteroid isomerase-like protein
MNDVDKLIGALNEWNAALDAGDINRLVATCDPEVIVCNENTPTTVGAQAIHDKYAPRMAMFEFKSEVDIKEIKVFGDFAVLVTHFNVKLTKKSTGEVSGGSGRLVIGYRKDQNGEWKMALDVDNNE